MIMIRISKDGKKFGKKLVKSWRRCRMSDKIMCLGVLFITIGLIFVFMEKYITFWLLLIIGTFLLYLGKKDMEMQKEMKK